MVVKSMIISFEKINSFAGIQNFRNQYLNGLIEPQELFLELFCRRAEKYLVFVNGESAGYFMMAEDSLLVEYFIVKKFIDSIDGIFCKIINDFAIKKAYCKSFDHEMMSCCLGLQKTTKVIGALFRERRQLNNLIIDDLKTRFADMNDFKQISLINEEVFEDNEEIITTITDKNMIIFEHENETAGFGIFQRNIEGRPEFDIGMLVDKKFRGRGYGKYIISFMADYCMNNGWRPTCGCAIENVASRKCLESAGFIAKYRMIEFAF